MGAPGLIVGSMGAGAISSAVGQAQSAAAQSRYYSYLADTSRLNAGLAQASGKANMQALGAETADQMRRTVSREYQTIGAQKVAMAGGVGGSSRSAQDIVMNTVGTANLDEQAINMNAEMKAKAIFAGTDMASFNDMSQARGYDLAGTNVQAALPFQLGSTLLGGAGQAASSYYMMSLYSRMSPGAMGGGVTGGAPMGGWPTGTGNIGSIA